MVLLGWCSGVAITSQTWKARPGEADCGRAVQHAHGLPGGPTGAHRLPQRERISQASGLNL